MRLAKRVLLITLAVLMMNLFVSAQTRRSDEDPRNTAPTVGTGGPVGGPTGLFTVYDGQTLRRGEFTFSIAYSNFDRDPGDVDFTEVPVSFQVGLNDYLELFFNTDAYRAVKTNSPRNLSGFYMPNSRSQIGGVGAFTSLPAIVLAPQGTGTNQFAGRAVFRPTGTQPFLPYPFIGGSAGTFGFGGANPGTVFGFPAGVATISVRSGSGNGASSFPGLGSPVGSILPGLVLQTTTVGTGAQTQEVPSSFTIAPSYLPDAPFLNRQYAESAFSTFTVGAKIRMTGPRNPVGVGIIPFYRYYADRADDVSGFNQLSRGASPGSKRGDFGVIAFADGRLRKWLNLSGNIGYVNNGSVKADFPGGADATLLDRGDELQAAIGIDSPVNKYFQLIGEARALKYVGGRTPNAFENDPIDLLAGVRIFPRRWFGMSFWYRYHANQQDRDSFEGNEDRSTRTVTIPGNTTTTTFTSTSTGVPAGFRTSRDPHGFGAQLFIGRRNARGPETRPNVYPVISAVNLGRTEVLLPCPPNTSSRSGCGDNQSVSVSTVATDADGDALVYNYTVSGGQITGTGANVTWDLTGVRAGTYTISVAADDGCGVCGQPTTREVRVVECPDCVAPPPPCPTVNVTGSSAVQEGELITFTANVDLQGSNPTYNWSVSAGEIESGQGTPTISVRATPGTAGSSITATVTLGNIDPSCQGTASASVPVERQATPPETRLIDQNDFVNNNDFRGRLDNLFTAVNSEPGSRGVIIVYGGERSRPRDIQRIIGVANNHISFRGQDPSRFTVINGGNKPGNTRPSTELYLVPQGATEPTPSTQE